MVVSFKIARIGTRYRPKPRPEPGSPFVTELNDDDEVDAPAQLSELQSSTSRKRSVDVMEDYCNIAKNADAEVSFILSIFSDGYTILDPSESNDWHAHDDPEFLHPYDRRSESMLTAIECGYLPTNFLDDIQCKYINGTVLCEVRDYRKESSESAVNIPSVKKVSLKMSLDNVVKDIHLIADNTWEYGDILELESRILLALQPKLYLDPTPNLDMLCRDPTSIKLNLDVRGKRLKRLRQVSAPESSNSCAPESIQDIRDRLSKIEMLTARFKLNCRKNKNKDYYKPTINFSTQPLKHALINNQDNDILVDGPCKMPLSMSLMGGNFNICKTRVLNFKLKEPPIPENGSVEIPKFYTGLILSERRSDGTVAMHHGDLDAVDYLPDDQLLSPLQNTHMADLLAKQFGILMLREGYEQTGDHLNTTPITMVRSAGGQQNTTPEDYDGWLLQILNDDPREPINSEPSIGGSSHHNMHPQIQRTMIMRPGCNHFSTVGFQGLGMGQNPMATRAMSPMMGQNLMATRQGTGQSNTNVPSGFVGQSSHFGGLQGANRQIHLGSGSGSGSSGVSMLGSGTGINRADHMMQVTQNRYMNQQQQQFQLIKQEPTSHLQALSVSGSGSSGVSMLGSGTGINRADHMMQMTQNHYMNQQQQQHFQLVKQEPTSHLQVGSGLGSGSSGVLMMGSSAGINRVNDMNAMQTAQNSYMNQQQLQLIKQQPTSNLQAGSFSVSGSSSVSMLGSGTVINSANMNAMQMAQNRYMNQQQQQVQLIKQEATSNLQAGSVLGSGSSGVSMLGSGTVINRANNMNAMQIGQNHYMNQQQFQLIKQDPTYHLQDGSGSSSGSSGVLMLGSGTGINRANDMNPMQRNFMAHMNQNRYTNQQQFQLVQQEPTSDLQAGSGSGSGPSLMLGSGTCVNMAYDMNSMQRNVMARLNPNRHMNQQQQFQLVKQEPTSHLHAVHLPPQQAGSPSLSTGRPHQMTGSPSLSTGRPHQMTGPHQPTP